MKKILLGLGATLASTLPLISVVACDSTDGNITSDTNGGTIGSANTLEVKAGTEAQIKNQIKSFIEKYDYEISDMDAIINELSTSTVNGGANGEAFQMARLMGGFKIHALQGNRDSTVDPTHSDNDYAFIISGTTDRGTVDSFYGKFETTPGGWSNLLDRNAAKSVGWNLDDDRISANRFGEVGGQEMTDLIADKKTWGVLYVQSDDANSTSTIEWVEIKTIASTDSSKTAQNGQAIVFNPTISSTKINLKAS